MVEVQLPYVNKPSIVACFDVLDDGRSLGVANRREVPEACTGRPHGDCREPMEDGTLRGSHGENRAVARGVSVWASVYVLGCFTSLDRAAPPAARTRHRDKLAPKRTPENAPYVVAHGGIRTKSSSVRV